MVLNFKKNIVVGVSVSSELGLEVAQIDYATKTVLKYACRHIDYDKVRKEIMDMDIFKDTLSTLLMELQIPKGTEIVLNLPTITFKVADYPASLDKMQITAAIEEELTSHPIFQNTEANVSVVTLPNSTMQFTKVACTASQKVALIEMAIMLKELGYKLLAIDTSVNTTLKALIYNERLNISPDISWLLLLVDDGFCRVVLMQGANYVDCIEEPIAIGEVLGDDENYSTVANTVNPLIKNLPSACLYVVSQTRVISAQILAEKLVYNAQIIHQEANSFSSAPFLDVAPDVDAKNINAISLGVIGAAITRDFVDYPGVSLNLYNESLGDVYLDEQPLEFMLGSHKLILSLPNMIITTILFVLVVLLITSGTLIYLNSIIAQKNAQLNRLNADIATIQKFLDANSSFSAEMFDEADEIKMGLSHNKNIYSYYTIVGTEIPQKLWLTNLILGKHTTIEGQADNLESVYSFFRNIKDYNTTADIKLQKLGLATNSKLQALSEEEAFDTDSIITSMNADFYEFKISNAPETLKKIDKTATDKNKTNKKNKSGMLELEPLE